MMDRRSFVAAMTAVTSSAWGLSSAHAAATSTPVAAAPALPLLVFADTDVAPSAERNYRVMARDAILSQPTQLQKLMGHTGRIAGIGPATDIFVAAGLLQTQQPTLHLLDAQGQLQSVPFGPQALLDVQRWLAVSPAQLRDPHTSAQLLDVLAGAQAALPSTAATADGPYFAWTLTHSADA